MHRICGSLARAGWQVTLVGRKRKSSVPLPSFPFRTRRLNCFFEKGRLFYAVLNLRLFWFLCFRRADVICAIDLDTWLACRWASRLKGAKLAYDAHELFSEVPEVVRRPSVQRIWQRIERRATTRSHIRYTVSQSVADHFKDKYGVLFHVIRNLPVTPSVRSFPVTDRSQAPATDRSEEPFILYQGALNEGRCLEQLLRAMPQIDARLKLAGEGDLSASLRKLAGELHLEDKVDFIGLLQPDELCQVTEQATLGYNLLENRGLSYYYSLGNKFFDYIHSGIPQLCADFPEYRRINDQFEVAVLTNNIEPEAIADSINRMLGDSALLSTLTANCKIAREELCWEKEEPTLVALYNDRT